MLGGANCRRPVAIEFRSGRTSPKPSLSAKWRDSFGEWILLPVFWKCSNCPIASISPMQG